MGSSTAGAGQGAGRTGAKAATTFFFGPEPRAENAAAWMKRHGRRKLEMEARALEKGLSSERTREEAAAGLVRLAQAGSAYAAWICGEQLLGEGDCDAALPMLEQAASAGIGAACLELARLAGADADRAGTWLFKGLELNSPGCALMLARLVLERRVILPDAAAGGLEAALLSAAAGGSWASLKTLVGMLRGLRPTAAHFQTVERVISLLHDASEQGGPEIIGFTAEVFADKFFGAPSEETDDLVETAMEGGWADAGCVLAERAEEDDRGLPGRAAYLTILYKVVDKGSDRARALLGRELCDRAGGDDAAFAEGFVLVAQALCTDTAFETAADCLWRICLPVRGRIDRAHPKAVALLELVAQRSPLARARLALLNLSGRDTRPKHAAKALKTLETLMRERCPEACGALADIYLYGLHGIAANWQKGLACALAGWDLHDQRSMALLVLNRLGETDLPPADSNPVTMDALPELVDFLNARGEPLIGAMQTALQMTPLPGQNRTANPEKAGRTFGWLLRKGIEEMDLSLLRLLARLAARLPQGEAADTAARGAAHLLPCVRMETRDDLAAFAARAAADPLAALRELGGESPAVRAPVRTDKGAERTAQKDAEEKRKARKKERQRRKQGRSKK